MLQSCPESASICYRALITGVVRPTDVYMPRTKAGRELYGRKPTPTCTTFREIRVHSWHVFLCASKPIESRQSWQTNRQRTYDARLRRLLLDILSRNLLVRLCRRIDVSCCVSEPDKAAESAPSGAKPGNRRRSIREPSIFSTCRTTGSSP